MKKSFLCLLLSLSFLRQAFAQTTVTATWMGGDSVIGVPSIYGTKGIPSSQNKPGGRADAISWTDASGNFWLFGGYGLASNYNTIKDVSLNDLWKYNPSTAEWAWVSGDSLNGQHGVYGTKGIPSSQNKPGGRAGAVSWTDASGNFWLFGGYGLAGSGGILNDLWKYNPSTGEWAWVSGDNITGQPGVYGPKGTAASTNKPGARRDAISWTDASGNLWLFGGSGFASSRTQGSLNDLWKYNPLTNLWTWVSGDHTTAQFGVYGIKGIPSSQNKPGGRAGAVSWTDASENLWLMGGYYSTGIISTGYLNDLWKYNPSTGEWTWVSGDNILNRPGVYGPKGTAASTNKPGARRDAISWTDASGNLWLFGGRIFASSRSGTFNDLWKYNPSTAEWTWVSGDSIMNERGTYGTKGIPSDTNKPRPRDASVIWTDASGNLWLMGGDGHSFAADPQYLNDLWRYTITESPQIVTTSVPSPHCAGSSLKIGFTIAGTFQAGNVFTAQLSDASGSFANPMNIGSVMATTSVAIEATIPANVPPGSSYRIRVVAASPAVVGRDNGSNLSINVIPVISITGGTFVSRGLQYKYYEGNWTSLPDFGGLTPVAAGIKDGVDVSLRKRDENFAFLWEGQIFIPNAGSYYFETHSDDGSRLYIGEYGHYITPVVNNDGEHAAQTSGGWYTFPVAGLYPIAIAFFQATGAAEMKVYWTAPEAGIPSRTTIPDAAFFHLKYNSSSAGLSYKYYEGSWSSLPDFGGLTPLATGTVGGVDIAPKRRNNNFAFLWEGRIFIPKGGTYYFETASDDGSRLYIGNYGHHVTPIVDNDGLHAMQFRGGSFTFPSAGMYPIAITFFEATGSEGIELYWGNANAGIPARTRIPNSAFKEVLSGEGCSPEGLTLMASEGDSYQWSTGDTTRSIIVKQNGSFTVTVTIDKCSATSEPMVVSCIDNSMTQKGGERNRSTAKVRIPASGQLHVGVLPNPSSTHFTLQISSAQSKELVTIRILDILGRVIETKTIAANTTLQIGHTYRPGTYFAEVVQGEKTRTVKLVKGEGF
ncbi:T9SS type A sorting domain-containing protein [Flavisolibacter sp. BT320]|nr:T9SS type A sorting domain-containing protein [Flavisolibacter longurius]